MDANIQSPILEHALQYAREGWPVFPCSPASKQPLCKCGFKDASVEPATIRKWWTRNPNAMIGVPTGDGIQAFVLDINPPEGMTAAKVIARIADACGGSIPTTRLTATPAGMHIWFRTPDWLDVRNRSTMLGGAIDCIRGTGGYVIVPPSQRHDGGLYRWGNESVIAEAPRKLLKLVKPVEYTD